MIDYVNNKRRLKVLDEELMKKFYEELEFWELITPASKKLCLTFNEIPQGQCKNFDVDETWNNIGIFQFENLNS